MGEGPKGPVTGVPACNISCLDAFEKPRARARARQSQMFFEVVLGEVPECGAVDLRGQKGHKKGIRRMMKVIFSASNVRIHR